MRFGFTLAEILIATTIFTLVAAIAMVAMVAIIKRNDHTYNLTVGTSELRIASDFITQAVRTSPIAPIISNSGKTLDVAPPVVYYATVADTAVVDALKNPNILGVLPTQDTIQFSVRARQPATKWILTGTCPSASISSTGSTFLTLTDHPIIDLDDMFDVGATISVPATRYGSAKTLVIQTITNTSSSKILKFTTPVGIMIPNGTQIAATSARRVRFEITSTGDLRNYPDSRNLTVFTVLATNVSDNPRVDASDSASANQAPFTLGSTAPTARNVTINLQRLPKGTITGRSENGIRSTIYSRTDPLTL